MVDPEKKVAAGVTHEEKAEPLETGGQEILDVRVEAGPSPEAAAEEITESPREERAVEIPAGMEAELAQKAAELEQKTAQAQEYLELAQRIKAEFENFKKRMIREETQLVEIATQRMIEKLLPVLDNFERAVYVAERTKEVEPLVRGIEIVYGELKDILEVEGLEEIPAEGRAFDPELHEAVMEVEAAGKPEHTVVDVLRKGYRLKGRLLRPALVKIAKK